MGPQKEDNVLVVDDEADVRTFVHSVLRATAMTFWRPKTALRHTNLWSSSRAKLNCW